MPPKLGFGIEASTVHGWGIHALHLVRRLMERELALPISLVPFKIAESFPLPHPLLEGKRGDFPVVWAGTNHPSRSMPPLVPYKDFLIAVFEWTDWTDSDFVFMNAAKKVITVSEWNAEFLRSNGVNAECAHLGVDPFMFKPAPRKDDGVFRIFSGGKPEFRKGQDIVLAAMKEFQRMHDDVELVTAWHNHWPETARSLNMSPYKTGSPLGSVMSWSEANGVKNHRDLGLIGRKDFAGWMSAFDVALFPNRCEGGTNMVAMECIASGVPTILSACPGHTDLIADGLYSVSVDGIQAGFNNGMERWLEPKLDGVIDALESVYYARDKMRAFALDKAKKIAELWNWDVRMDDQIVKLGLDKLAEAAPTVRKYKPDDALNFAEALASSAIKLRNIRHDAAALASAKRALALDPNNARIKNDVANVMITLGKVREAKVLLHEALREIGIGQQPHVKANLGLSYHYLGDDDTAEKYLKDTADLMHDVKWDLANVQLIKGDFENGLENYEVRKQRKPQEYKVPMPEWDGSDQPSKTLLVYVEQGQGDVIQFSRFLPWAASKVGGLMFLCYHNLTPFFFGFPGVDLVIAHVDGMPMPKADLCVPIGSLMRLYKARVDNMPPDTGWFIEATKTFLKDHEVKVSAPADAIKVGIVWQGSPSHVRDRERSIPLEKMLGLTQATNAVFYSLQVGEVAKEIEGKGAQALVCDLSAQLKSWMQTAGAIMHLDLIITVDTAVAHLAAALGKPVWLMIQRTPDWRWLRNRTDSIWYPNIRLWRQERIGDWDSVIMKVATALRSYKPGNA